MKYLNFAQPLFPKTWLKVTLMLMFLSTLNLYAAEDRFTNPIFLSGEKLLYTVSYMGIEAGTIKIELIPDVQYNNQPVYKAIVTGETSRTFSRFFKVKDVITSIFSQDKLLTNFYSKNIREGKYRKDREYVFDQITHSARSDSKAFDLMPESRDPLACIFKLRWERLNLNSAVEMNANSDGKNYPIIVHITKREIVQTAIGPQIALVCEPMPTWEGRVFEKNKSKATMWLSDDKIQVPLLISIKVRIGSLKAVLVQREGPGWIIERTGE